jgi:hypothetical protein
MLFWRYGAVLERAVFPVDGCHFCFRVYLLWDECFKNGFFYDGLLLHFLVLYAELVHLFRYVGVQ